MARIGRTGYFKTGAYDAHSVLDQYYPSGDGMSRTDAQRLMPGGGEIPTSNGMSKDTYQKIVSANPARTETLK